MAIENFKFRLREEDLENIVDTLILEGDALHFTNQQIAHVAAVLSRQFAIEVSTANLRIIGSAKIGFSLHPKKTPDGTLPAFRSFRPDSDIDIAITSEKLFEIIWDELSTHANNTLSMPWNSGKLGDYMIHGWIRPDYFPKHTRLRRCDDWWDIFRMLSVDDRLGRRTIRGALYFSHEHLRRYQLRGLTQCKSRLEINI